MSSLGKVMANAVSNVTEVSPALANFNFDFTLYRVEPPAEFEGVGKTMSKTRRVEAEAGPPHIVAQQLGALFKNLLPKTPRLTSAYGLRASEISRSPLVNPQGAKSDGFFQHCIGADATTIWAGATSGAIAVHLLACMLARMWTPPEAVSIWNEIVAQRKQDILREFDETDIASQVDLAAAKQDISQKNLELWDSSARAWLRSADRANFQEQKRLMLILENIDQQVNRAVGEYENVIQVWKNSLKLFEDMMNGAPQIAEGELLLALSAWHLYPDLDVVEPSLKQIKQKDQLLTGCGTLTVGLEKGPASSAGLTWSLPLERLRHYGPAVRVERSISDSQRLSIDELLLAFLGCFLHGWGEYGKSGRRAITWLEQLHHHIQRLASTSERAQKILDDCRLGAWLGLLFRAAQYYLSLAGKDSSNADQLIHLGRTRGKAFLGQAPAPFFNLFTHGRFVRYATDDEHKIATLRTVAQRLPIDAGQCIIRVKHDFNLAAYPGMGHSKFEYATAKPRPLCSLYEGAKRSEQFQPSHARWLHDAGSVDTLEQLAVLQIDVQKGQARGRKLIDATLGRQSRKPASRPRQQSLPAGNRTNDFELRRSRAVQEEYRIRSRQITESGELVIVIREEPRETVTDNVHGLAFSLEGDDREWFWQIYGDNTAGLYVSSRIKDKVRPRNALVESDLFLGARLADDAFDFFEGGDYNAGLLIDDLFNSLAKTASNLDPYLRSLKLVSTAASLYRISPEATVDVRILEHHLLEKLWARELSRNLVDKDTDPLLSALAPYSVTHPEAFACLCFFETGRLDVSPSQLENVMAMSSSDAIYVASDLLQDPAERLTLCPIRRVTGSINRPGITFLIPPKEPMISQSMIEDFRRRLYADFDNNLKDNFSNTSMHLSFTTAERNLEPQFAGARTTEAHLLETVLSVHDGGKWIADLDILGTQTRLQYINQTPCSYSVHST